MRCACRCQTCVSRYSRFCRCLLVSPTGAGCRKNGSCVAIPKTSFVVGQIAKTVCNRPLWPFVADRRASLIHTSPAPRGWHLFPAPRGWHLFPFLPSLPTFLLSFLLLVSLHSIITFSRKMWVRDRLCSLSLLVICHRPY